MGRAEPGHAGVYALTPAGQALTPIVWAMGAWAAEWMFGDPSDEQCDGLTLIWRTHQIAVPAKLPEHRTVVHLVLTGAGRRPGLARHPASGHHRLQGRPGHWPSISPSKPTPPRCTVGSSDVVPFRDLVANGHARFLGPSRLAKAFPTWFDTTLFAKSLQRAEQRRLHDALTG